MGVKISVSIPEDELALLDELIAREELPNRSAGVRRAIEEFRRARLAAEYKECFSQPSFEDEAKLWEDTLADGLDNA